MTASYITHCHRSPGAVTTMVAVVAAFRKKMRRRRRIFQSM